MPTPRIPPAARRGLALLLALAVSGPVAAQNDGTPSTPPDSAEDALAALDGRLTSVRFYPQGDVTPLSGERVTTRRFERARTQYVGTELTFQTAPVTELVEFTLDCTYTAEGADAPYARFDMAFTLQPGWTGGIVGRSSGFAEPGRWVAATYDLACTLGDRTVAEGRFEVVDGPPDVPSMGAHLTRIRFYESDGSPVAYADRAHTTTFASADTRYLNVELDFSHPALEADVRVPAVCVFIRANGAVYGAADLSIQGIAGRERTIANRGFGTAEGGSWGAGRYRVVCTSGDRLLGDAVFVVQ